MLALSGLARTGYLHRLVAEEINAAQDFKADRIFTDLDPGAFLTSAVSGLPIASAYASIASTGRGTFFWKLMQRAINPVLQSYKKPAMTPDELFFGESVLKIIPSIPELDDTNPARRDVRYVGQLIGVIRSSSPADFQIEEGRRYVFVYTGTGSISLDVLENTLPQLFPQDGDVTCMVGAQSLARPYRLGGVTFRPYVPADALLPHCDWTICHGGQNTIIHSLLYSVPLIIFPGPIFERRHNAKKVMQAGAGLMSEVNEFNPAWLRAAFEKRATFASKAAVLSQRIHSYGGAEAAVEAIAAWEG
ncbi:MAG TPA: hypothetical protein G4N95_06190 [Anaerolineae bacterium]|nr:hypothetical protein [Anaerolineae bacterium]